jgi:hypothetical protein
MDIDSFLKHFSNVRKTSNGWQACCPAHDDKKASLSITVVEGRKILLYGVTPPNGNLRTLRIS